MSAAGPLPRRSHCSATKHGGFQMSAAGPLARRHMSRFTAACEASPAPAVLAWSAGGALHWQTNAAARRWEATRGWADDAWTALAQRIVDAALAGRTEGDWPSGRLHW